MSKIDKGIWSSNIISPFNMVYRDSFVSGEAHAFHCEGAKGYLKRKKIFDYNIQRRSHRVNRHGETFHDYIYSGYEP